MNSSIKKQINFKNFIKKKKVGILIITKLGSKRLKDKIKARVNQITLTEILIKRLVSAIGNQNLVICSSGKNSKYFLKPFVKKYKIKLFLGQNKNVLGRILDCMQMYNYKHFVRVTGDNPFTDCDALQKMVKSHVKKKNDYTYTNRLPKGMQPEVFSLEALNKYKNKIIDRNSTEYLTYFFLRRDLYKIENFKMKQVVSNQQKLSISIDYYKNLKLLVNIMNTHNNNIYLKSRKIINFLKNNTRQINYLKKVPIKCKSYDVRYSFDKKKKFINLD